MTYLILLLIAAAVVVFIMAKVIASKSRQIDILDQEKRHLKQRIADYVREIARYEALQEEITAIKRRQDERKKDLSNSDNIADSFNGLSNNKDN